MCVRDDQVRRGSEAAPVLDAPAGHALDLDGRRRRSVPHGGRQRDGPGRCAGVLRRPQRVEDAWEVVGPDEPSQGLERVGGLREGAVDPPGDGRVADLLGRPSLHVRHGGEQQPQSDDHAEDTGDRSRHAVDLPQRSHRDLGVEAGAGEEPQSLPHEAGTDERGRDDQKLVPRRRPPQGVDDVGKEVGGDGQAQDEPHP